ncbi:MAG: exodeoxyribonuclease VII large subunit [Phycisphaerae bacterium]
MVRQNAKIYSVVHISMLIKEALENNLPGRFTVSGQLGDWRKHSSGHCYFSLKDDSAILPCVMWRSSTGKLKFEPESGMAVFATGHIDVYLPQGKYQLIVDKLEPAGIGTLQLAFEQMVKRLHAEGLFEQEHKKPLPPYPSRIGIITSESGAAVHDITDSIWNRWPCAKLYLYPVAVQGDGAAEQIAGAIKDINARNKNLGIDLLIVGRGGGSLEDLWAFNEEIAARAIYNSKIPIVSAVGHEIDTTIADLVADVRASTPTKAGIVAVPDIEEVSSQLKNYSRNLSDRTRWKLQIGQQRLDELSYTISNSLKDLLAAAKAKLSEFFEKVLRIEPHRLIARKTVDLNNLQNRANFTVKTRINKLKMHLDAQANRLAGLNPKSVLHRGYSITTDKITGRLIRKINDIKPGQIIVTEIANENLIESKVITGQNNMK